MEPDKKFEYISKLLGREVKSGEDITEYENKIIKNALKKAWEIRNFEIKLYWQRALYFWGFIALAFYAPIAILKFKTDFILHPMLNKFFFITIICMLGCFLSFAWYLANRGSKYWQENWENWINTLEEYKYGNLYSEPFEQKDIKSHWSGSGKFSLSRINIVISLVVTVVWGFTGVFCAFNINPVHSFCSSIIVFLILAIFCRLFWFKMRS